MITKDFDRKKMDVKLEEVIDRVNSFGAVKQMVMLPPTVLCSIAAKGAPGILQLPKCYFSKLMYWVVASNAKDKIKLEVTISDHETNSTSSRNLILKEDVGEIAVATKVPNQVLIECSTVDDAKISLCFIVYLNDPTTLVADHITLKKLSELGDEL